MAWLSIALLAAQLYATDLGTIKQEPNLERRSDLALQYANSALDTAREAYTAGNVDKTEAAIEEAAHAHPDYLAWITERETGRMEFMGTELELERCRRRCEMYERGRV